MKRLISLVLALMLLTCFSNVSFAQCRVSAKVKESSEIAYKESVKAADTWETLESEASTRLQTCLSGIKSINITIPNFISLSAILDKIADQICRKATEKINDLYPSTINPWEDIEIITP